MIHRPDENIAQYLNDQGAGVYSPESPGGNIFIGPMRPPKTENNVIIVPDRSAWVKVNEGGQPDRVFGQAYRYHKTPVQVMVRGDPNDYENTRDWAQELWDTLEGSRPTGYDVVLAMQGGPVHVGFDSGERSLWSLNFLANYAVTETA